MILYECSLGHKWGKAGYGQDLTDNILRTGNSRDCPTCKVGEFKRGETMRRQMTFLDIKCPGCDEELTTENAGGYRTFCRKCVKSMPPFPKDKKGHLIKEGCKYPNLEWD